MMAAHCRALIAPVPESVRKSRSTSSASSLKTFSLAASSRRSRSSRVVTRMGSTDLMRKGSMMVRGMGVPPGHLCRAAGRRGASARVVRSRGRRPGPRTLVPASPALRLPSPAASFAAMPAPAAPLEPLRAALLAEAARRAPATLEALAHPPPSLAAVPERLADQLFGQREALLPALDAALAAPAPGGGFALDPAGALATEVLSALRARNQFLPLDAAREADLGRIDHDALRAGAEALRAAGSGEAFARALAPVLAGYLAALSALVRGLAAGAGAPALREVVSAEYDPELQLRVLGLDPAALAEPILDLGCGVEARLVRWLRARGLAAEGIDRAAEPAEGIHRAGWLEVPLAPGSLGTVVSHLGFSLHFLHQHLRPGDEALRYARRYMEILRALRPGGLFAYAPGLPFVEEHLPAAAWQVERTRVPVPQPAEPGAAALPWYACRVRRAG